MVRFSDRLEGADRGTAYFVGNWVWYFVMTTPSDFRFYTIFGNHHHEIEKVYNDEELDFLIESKELEHVDWTFV